MVSMIEPGAYDPDVGGVRLEWMFRVTETATRFSVRSSTYAAARRGRMSSATRLPETGWLLTEAPSVPKL